MPLTSPALARRQRGAACIWLSPVLSRSTAYWPPAGLTQGNTVLSVLVIVFGALSLAVATMVLMYRHAQKVLGPRPKKHIGTKKLKRELQKNKNKAM